MWFEFVVPSRPCSEDFSPGFPVFLPPQKTKQNKNKQNKTKQTKQKTKQNKNKRHTHFQIPSGISGRRATLWRCHRKFQFIYYFIIIIIVIIIIIIKHHLLEMDD